jgi:hypothetical protein
MWLWLNGQMHVLHAGRDYPPGAPFPAIRKRLRQAAWRRGVTVKIANMGDERVFVQASEDASEHREAIRAMLRAQQPEREPAPLEVDNEELRQEVQRLLVEVAELKADNARIMREFSAYRLEHPIR